MLLIISLVTFGSRTVPFNCAHSTAVSMGVVKHATEKKSSKEEGMRQHCQTCEQIRRIVWNRRQDFILTARSQLNAVTPLLDNAAL